MGKIFKNAKLMTEAGFVDPGYLIIDERGTIEELGHQETLQTGGTPYKTTYEIIDVNGGYLVPGLIDIHTHGACGYDVMDGTWRAMEEIAAYHRANGVTGFLGTTMAASPEKLSRCARVWKKYYHSQGERGNFLGIHMEGPYINRGKRGVQSDKWIRQPNLSEFQALTHFLGPVLKVVTLAPELPGTQDIIKLAVDRGIVVSAGHSLATYDEMVTSFGAGVTHGTHLFNGMRSLHHREPGVAGALLDHSEATVELVVDGHHLHPAFVRLVYNAIDLDRILLVSDCTRGTGLSRGTFNLEGETVFVEDGMSWTDEGILAGSVTPLLDSLRQFVEVTGAPLEEAVKLASFNPARLLNLDHERGSLAPGKRGDLLVLNDDYALSMTIVKGDIVEQ